jgi:hypothetical protein
MPSAEAIATALGMLNFPHMTRGARHSPLPKGVTFLLEVAAGESETLRNASVLTGRTEATLRKAAGFFIEQVLLSEHADNYRILGCSCEASHGDLRRHMALIMRWLHPDVVCNGAQTQRFDRGLYADRVAVAWEALKTKERREAYDASLAACTRMRSARDSRRLLIPHLGNEPAAIGRKRFKKQRALNPSKSDSFWSRILLLFAGRP